MVLPISPLTTSPIEGISSPLSSSSSSSLGSTSSAAGSVSFSEMAEQALAAADTTQVTANTEASKLAAGEGNVHEAALALEKADISMRLLIKSRNKLVEAYQEVMRMQV
jgi:flagellar hook-basal body complex protein FliE